MTLVGVCGKKLHFCKNGCLTNYYGMRKTGIIIISLGCVFASQAQRPVNLETCRQWALEHNKTLKVAKENVRAAEAMSKAAFTQFLPNFSATGAYLHNQKNLSLMGEDAYLPVGVLDGTGNFGIGVTETSVPTIHDDGTLSFGESSVNNRFTTVDGQMVPLDAQGQPFDPQVHPEKIDWKNYAMLPKSAMEFDARNIFVGGISFVQPLFMGGKIVQLNAIAKSNVKIAEARVEEQIETLLLNVDKAYWRVVSVENKATLAREYRGLVDELNRNMEALHEEGMVTKADVLKVRVKLNEADVSLAKVENGLTLSRMALNQLCGLPLEEQVVLEDAALEESLDFPEQVPFDRVWANRPEMKILRQAGNIAAANKKMQISNFLPSIALTGGYVATNPNLFNGFEKKLNGMFTFGVTASVPLFHFGEKRHALNASRSQAVIAKLEMEEAKEKIELQVHQNRHRVEEGVKKQAATRQNIAQAEENLRYAREGFNEGVITSTDLLMAQTAWLSARSEYIDATIEVKLNSAYLKKSQGTLSYEADSL